MMNHIVKPISAHSSVYRRFLIVREPRNKTRLVTRYSVSQGDDCYGKFDALAQATAFIDGLFNERAAFTGSHGGCKI